MSTVLEPRMRPGQNDQLSHSVAHKLAHGASRSENAVILGDRHGVVEWVNAAWTRVTGYALEDSVGKPITALLQQASLDVDVVDFVRRRFVQGLRCQLEFPLDTPEGGQVWLHLEVSPLRDRYGEVSDFIAVATDITARRLSEVALGDTVRDRAPKTVRFDRRDRPDSPSGAMGRLSIELAAEVGSVAAEMRTHVDALLARECVSEKASLMQEIRRLGERVERRTGQLLAFAESAHSALERCDLSEIVARASRRVSADVGGRVAFDLDLPTGLPRPQVSRAALEGTIESLIRHASVAIGGEWGTITLTTGQMEAGRAILVRAHPAGAAREGHYVCVEVGDTGNPLSAEERDVVERGDDPTAPLRALALSAAVALMHSQGGALAVDSSIGCGTTVTLLFPC